MFRFNFNSEDNIIANTDTISTIDTSGKPEECLVKLAEEIRICEEKVEKIIQQTRSSQEKFNTFVSNDIEIGYLDVTLLLTDKETDVVPNVYEGGFKIWECTQDIMDFLTSTEELKKDISGKTICDLGCSAGLLGIVSLGYGAKHVHFQDFNEEVLEEFTIPNVINYLEENGKSEDFAKCKFYCGDWSSFQQMNLQVKYDFIFTAETIYNSQNYLKLLNFFKAKLHKEGFIYLSAKSWYFGLSGNVLDFCKILDHDNTFQYEAVWKSVEGVQREIIKIKFKS